MEKRTSNVNTYINLHTSSHRDARFVFILQDMHTTTESEEKYGKDILEERGVNGSTKIKYILTRQDGIAWTRITLVGIWPISDFCGKGHEPLCSINCVLFLSFSSHFYFQKNNSALRSFQSERLSPK